MGSENGILGRHSGNQKATTFTSRRPGDWQYEVTLEAEVAVGLETGRWVGISSGSCQAPGSAPCPTQPDDCPPRTQAKDWGFSLVRVTQRVSGIPDIKHSGGWGYFSENRFSLTS